MVANRLKRNSQKWWGRLAKLAVIQTTDPELERKGKMLALYIALMIGLNGYMLFNNIYILLAYQYPEYKVYLVQDIVAFLPLFTLWKLNQTGRVILTGYLAIGFSIATAALGADAKFMEYLMVVFSLPVGISSFVIRPSSSFLFAFFTAAAYTASSLITGHTWEYNLTAIIALFSLALMTWAVANQLENALQKNDAMLGTLRKSNREIRDAYETTLEGWSRALEIRDRETEGHTQRVIELTNRIALRMGFREEQLLQIHRGVLLHDIGKLGIPDSILHKPDKLTGEEMAVMRTHPQIAYDLLNPIEYLRPALDIPHLHHEKWDGTGYPMGLRGEDIPLEARIFAIVDVYDALSYDRPYRKAWSKEKVLNYIQSESGKHFDPAVVDIFIQEIAKYEN